MPEVRYLPTLRRPDAGRIGRLRRKTRRHPGTSGRRSKPSLGRTSTVPPVPLLAPGSHDDSFFDSPSSSQDLPGRARPDPRTNSSRPRRARRPRAVLDALAHGPVSGASFPVDRPRARGSAPRPFRPSKARRSRTRGEDDEPEGGGPPGPRSSWPATPAPSLWPWLDLDEGAVDRGEGRSHADQARRRQVSRIRPAGRAFEEGRAARADPGRALRDDGQAAPGRLAGNHADRGATRRTSRSNERHPTPSPTARTGGKSALVLRLKLKNTSNDAVFAPLDQAYLRERGKEIVDTFVETAGP